MECRKHSIALTAAGQQHIECASTLGPMQKSSCVAVSSREVDTTHATGTQSQVNKLPTVLVLADLPGRGRQTAECRRQPPP